MKTGRSSAGILTQALHRSLDRRILFPLMFLLISAFALAVGSANAELRPLDDLQMAAISGQGVDDDQKEIQAQNASLNGLTQVVQSAFPVLGLIDADTSVSGVRYAEGVSPLEINLADGSITINLPEYIESVSFGNLRPLGASSNGPSFGSVQIQGLSFKDSSITIRMN
ncbi:hypothetical protein [Parendozoicomonas sp. Alg238-R29]|uniref:hypothetical protein n=1 Tax=Parendozoicomonas sp. Alg238-R29 TaxID=2993446 RepID=UPI00248F05A8|nr:hypothetical protein [Parendozoicomonas sp. Alg238-R29]